MDGVDAILADCPGLGRVRLCDCNSVHLTIGPVTVSLAPEAFLQTATLMRKAVEQWTEIAGEATLSAADAQHSRFKH